MTQTASSTPQAPANRWLIAVMGTLLMTMLGTVYAWSFFQKLIVTTYGWTNTQTAWAFSLAICFLGLAAAWGGINLAKIGPTKLAMLGGCFFVSGYLIASFAFKIHSLPLLCIGYGVIGGIGLGLGYVTPVATVAKWFPDKKGFATGMVVMGFGLGALVMSKVIAPTLMAMTNNNIPMVFMYTGGIMVIAIICGAFIKNPPAGYLPAGYTPPAPSAAAKQSDSSLTVGMCVKSSKFMLMWFIFFINITSGIMFIGFQSPMIQDLLHKTNPALDTVALAAAGATLIAISSLFNGVGRFFWGGLSDKIGRIQAFRLILATQIIAFIALRFVDNHIIFGTIVCYVLLCYGGGFGTMPSFVLDVFGQKLMPVVYGCVLTAWSTAGLLGPQIAAYIKDNYKENAGQLTFTVGAVLLAIGFVVSLMMSNTPYTKSGDSK